MINVDSRLIDAENLDRLDADELYMAVQITKRINKQRTCFPSIKLLSRDSGFCIDKTQAVLRRLEKKGIIAKKVGGGRVSNLYTVLSPLLKNYQGSEITPGENVNSQPTENITPQPPDNLPGQQGDKSGKEVLVIQELNNEELTNEILAKEREREKIFYKRDIQNIYEEIILYIYPQFDRFKDEYEDSVDKLDDATVKSSLKKIYAAAKSLYSAYKQLNLPIPTYRIYESRMFWTDDEERKPDPKKDAIDQVQSYAEMCRLTGKDTVNNPDYLCERILQSDWCQKLKDYAEPRFPHQYDPMDDFDSSPDWVMWYFYEQQMMYVDKRNPKRIF